MIAIPKILQDKLGHEGAQALAETFNKLEESHRENTLEIAENRFERSLMEETKKLELKISDIEVKIATVQSNLIKWMFIFWAGQVSMTAGLLFTLLK